MPGQQRKSIGGEYIRANFRPEDRLAVVLLHKRSGAVITRVSTADKIAGEEYQAWLRHMNAQRHEVYVSMNNLRPEARGRFKADIAEIRHLYLDFDRDGAEAVAAMRGREDMPAPNHILTSSPGKFQVVWRVEGFRKDRAEELMRGMTRALGADVAATDCARVLRVPGFYNHKYETPHFVTVENLSRDVYRPERFPEFATEGLSVRADLEGRRMRTEGAVDSAGGSSQSERDWAFAMRSLARGEDAESVIRAIEGYRSDKPDPGYYARYTVEKAQAVLQRGGQPPTGETRSLTLKRLYKNICDRKCFDLFWGYVSSRPSHIRFW
jgi:hypothetical protein